MSHESNPVVSTSIHIDDDTQMKLVTKEHFSDQYHYIDFGNTVALFFTPEALGRLRDLVNTAENNSASAA